jgi:methyl coenzyme M reductase subunit D
MYFGFLFGQDIKKNIEINKIEAIKIRTFQTLRDFKLFQERLSKPDSSNKVLSNQLYRMDIVKNKMVCVEEDQVKKEDVIGSSCSQKWYRSDFKEKIEIDIIICSLNTEVNKTIEFYIKNRYACQYTLEEITSVGEKSWIPKYSNPKHGSCSIIFVRSNVIIRVYMALKDTNTEEYIELLTDLAEELDKKILEQI